jgi:hypothetical protein
MNTKAELRIVVPEGSVAIELLVRTS